MLSMIDRILAASLTRQSRNQTGRVFDAEARRRGEKNAEEDRGESTPENAEEVEGRGLAPGEFPWNLALAVEALIGAARSVTILDIDHGKSP